MASSPPTSAKQRAVPYRLTKSSSTPRVWARFRSSFVRAPIGSLGPPPVKPISLTASESDRPRYAATSSSPILVSSTRSCFQMSEPEHDGSNGEHRQVVDRAFLVAGRDAPE